MYIFDLDKYSKVLLSDENIASFISSNDLFIISGQEKSGKSLYLILKSIFNRTKQEGIYHFPINNHIESINITFSIYDYQDLIYLSKIDWEKYWTLSISTFIINFLESRNEGKISKVCTKIFDEKYQNHKFGNLVQKKLNKIALIKTDINIYLDDIHDSLYNSLKNNDWIIMDPDLCKGILSNYVLGLSKAIINLNRIKNKIKIYITLQTNLLNSLSLNQVTKISSYTFNRNYQNNDLISLFENNIKLSNKVFESNSSSLSYSYFGFEYIEYSLGDNDFIKETPIDYLVRHTRGNPIEVLRFGKYFDYFIIDQSKYLTEDNSGRIQMFKNFIAEFSEDILYESFPKFENENFENIVKYVKQLNTYIIDYEEVFSNFEIITKLYELGLVGTLDKNREMLIQNFTLQNNVFEERLKLPYSKFYILHPLLHKHIKKNTNNQYPIIGNNHVYMENEYLFDIAFSFAGEDRSIVEEIVNRLKNEKLSFFYDNHHKAELWGKDLYQYLSDLYTKKAKYCVIFVSENYANKLWTKHELRSAQERAFSDSNEYILPILLDNTELPGLNKTIGYIKHPENSIKEITELIIQKLKK